jgi:hypothetical protein
VKSAEPPAEETVPATIEHSALFNPVAINLTTHQEWNDSDLEMSDLFDPWNATNELQQRWVLLLLDAILVNTDPVQTLQVRCGERAQADLPQWVTQVRWLND